MISVLHVDSSRSWGGGQNQVRLLMRELARDNVQQLCICPGNSALGRRLAQDGLPVRAVPWSMHVDPRALFAITNTLARYEIVHCHDAHALQLGLVAARLRRRSVVASRRVRFKTNPFTWNRADRIIAISETVRTSLLRSGIDPGRIRVIHSGIDVAEARNAALQSGGLRARLSIASGAFVVGNAGSLYEAKGQILIPEAAALLPDVHWLIAGEGPQRSAIEAAIRQHDVGSRVHLLGWLEDSRTMLADVDVFVSTSIDDALGNVVLEAMAAHVPVLATDIGGPAEVLQPINNQRRVLFAPRSARALVDALSEMRDPQTREFIVAAQDQRIRDFAISRTAQATLTLYRELCGHD